MWASPPPSRRCSAFKMPSCSWTASAQCSGDIGVMKRARRIRAAIELVKSGEHRVIGGANDAFMDKAIATVIRQQIASAIMLDHIGLQDGNFAKLLVCNTETGQFTGGCFQGFADFEQFLDVLLRELGGARSTVGQQHDKPVGRQDLQGFAQRGTRDAQRCAQLPLRYPRARRNFPFHQNVPEAGNHLVVQHELSPRNARFADFEFKIHNRMQNIASFCCKSQFLHSELETAGLGPAIDP